MRLRPLRSASLAAIACAAALAAIAALAAAPGPAAAGRDGYGDYVKAARLLNSWRFEEARALIDRLAKRRPDAPETRYLRAELAFLDGDYAGAIAHLEGLEDRDVYDNVGPLRRLAASTYQTTRNFASKPSASGRFVFFYPPGRDEVVIDLAGEVLDAAYEALAEDLGFRPDRPIRVEILAHPRDLARVSTLTERDIETTGTIALCKYGKLMVVTPRATVFGYPWKDTLVHEYVHYAVSQLSHDRVPVWLHEGLAKFLQVRWRGPAGGDLSASEEHLLAAALKKNALIPFDDMHPSMAKLPSQEAAALAFAEVFSMIAYVHGRVGYEGLRGIIGLIRDGKNARRAVAEILGQRWPEVERDWKRHLRSLDLRTSTTLAGRAGSRIRFRKGEGDEENVGLDQVASERARKFTRLGGILRARGMTEAARIEYEKALAIVGPGDPFVVAKLSRTYLELGEYDRAIELAGPLSAADDHDAAPATTLGVAHMARKEAAPARDAFEVALRTTPFDPTVRCGLADAYATLGDEARAERERRACRTLRP